MVKRISGREGETLGGEQQKRRVRCLVADAEGGVPVAGKGEGQGALAAHGDVL